MIKSRQISDWSLFFLISCLSSRASFLLNGFTEPLKHSDGLAQMKVATRFYNLAVKQKAVYQPTLKLRRWMEQRKDKAIYNSASISSIETNLPHLRGPEASIKEYVGKLKDVEAHLDSFYNSNMVLKKHRWNARKARDEEYLQIANRLFKLVGGSIGAKRKDSNKVVIGVGLGKFSTKTRLSSLHEPFQS
ncbi:hypothetical protein EDD21DRAFT_418911 [Dissophora ornata]|nr:hypothetical protein EDD21DRAFT_418911 [Dissophora ornata]